MWCAAATLVVLLSGAGALWGGARVQAADGRVVMSDSDSDAMKWHFDPAGVTVTAGSTVVWHNGGNQPHTVTADDGKSFNSPSVPTGGDFQFKFSTAGDFAYHCEPHPWMKAVVHVVGAPTPTPAAPQTTTTQPASVATTATSAPAARSAAAQPSTTTTSTTAASTAAGSASTTTTAGAVTTTTIASAAAPTAASDAVATTTTTAAGNAAEGAEAAPKGRAHKKNSPVGITFAAVSTLLLTAVAAKLLASKP
jgi:plastocyanin